MVKFHYTFIINPIINITLFFLVLRTLIVVISSRWFIIWLIIEFNIIIFIPWMNYKNINLESEASIKYFLCQALGSAIIIYSSMHLRRNMVDKYALIIALCLKIGRFPCYMWFISVIKSSNWISCTILITWQKIAPLFIISKFILNIGNFILIISILNILIGGIFGINQTDLRSILAYSRVAHLGWIFILYNYQFFIYIWEYFFIYLILVIPICIIYININPKTGIELFNINILNQKSKLIVTIIMLSLAGLPPLSGFLLKLIALFPISNIRINVTILIVILSVLSLYIYISFMLPTSIIIKPSLNQKSITVWFKLVLINTFMLPIIIFLYALTILN